ncbi:MAG: DUF3500 domain-containing protein, partial [Verrucomicrobiae bacterium]|nr:DUF3500 domain-containing protein [Verrucomicrobiae bacterium]
MFMRLSIAFLFTGLVSGSSAQPSQDAAMERFREMSRRNEASLEGNPFVGVTSDGKVEKGLYKIESTGVSADSIREAALAFLNSLSGSEKTKTLFSVDDDEWRKWMNQHFYIRQGMGFEDMNDKQKERAFDLLRSSLSPEGFKLARNIMKLNHTLGEMGGDMFMLGEWAYWITIMGEPSRTEPWGWQIDGHHLIINFFVLGDQVVTTPTFVGSEPVIATEGKFAGIEILQEEQDRAAAFMRGLSST